MATYNHNRIYPLSENFLNYAPDSYWISRIRHPGEAPNLNVPMDPYIIPGFKPHSPPETIQNAECQEVDGIYHVGQDGALVAGGAAQCRSRTVVTRCAADGSEYVPDIHNNGAAKARWSFLGRHLNQTGRLHRSSGPHMRDDIPRLFLHHGICVYHQAFRPAPQDLWTLNTLPPLRPVGPIDANTVFAQWASIRVAGWWARTFLCSECETDVANQINDNNPNFIPKVPEEGTWRSLKGCRCMHDLMAPDICLDHRVYEYEEKEEKALEALDRLRRYRKVAKNRQSARVRKLVKPSQLLSCPRCMRSSKQARYLAANPTANPRSAATPAPRIRKCTGCDHYVY